MLGILEIFLMGGGRKVPRIEREQILKAYRADRAAVISLFEYVQELRIAVLPAEGRSAVRSVRHSREWREARALICAVPDACTGWYNKSEKHWFVARWCTSMKPGCASTSIIGLKSRRKRISFTTIVSRVESRADTGRLRLLVRSSTDGSRILVTLSRHVGGT